MTPAAWWMLGLTWLVVVSLTGRFLWKVLTLPPRSDPGAPPQASPPEKP